MRDAWVYSTSRDIAADIAAALAELGYAPRHVSIDEELVPTGRDGLAVRPPALAVVAVGAGEEVGRLLERLQDTEELRAVPLLVAVEPEHLGSFGAAAMPYELVVRPFSLAELDTRVVRATSRAERGEAGSNIVAAGLLEMNLATHQVSIEGRPIDLAKMEYALLKFLMTHPDRAFSREAILTRVWGWDYYGGVRTVDVHIRRVRAKLGEEHAARITTIRGVGYLFGLSPSPPDEPWPLGVAEP